MKKHIRPERKSSRNISFKKIIKRKAKKAKVKTKVSHKTFFLFVFFKMHKNITINQLNKILKKHFKILMKKPKVLLKYSTKFIQENLDEC
jgi:hypothetical protein